MIQLPDNIQNSVLGFSKLPGVGEKTARRQVMAMTKWNAQEISEFSNSLQSLNDLRFCTECGMFCEEDTCTICEQDERKHAEIICEKSNSRLTSLRKRVLELVWARHSPMKAYDLLNELQKEDPSAKPPTIYRTLDFLLEHGLVHKIHRLNSYVGCVDPNEKKPCFFLICKVCDKVTESHNNSYYKLLNEVSENFNFQITYRNFKE